MNETKEKPEVKKIEVMEIPVNTKAPTISMSKKKDIVIITIPNSLHPTFARGFCAEITIFIMDWFQAGLRKKIKQKEDAEKFTLANGIKNIKNWGKL